MIDEAHEGIDTTKTDVAFDQIKRKWTLHLSGTPFKALASGKFDQDQIFNWTYEDEQTARQQWEDDGQENPYAALPTLNLLTYQISRMITDRLAEGVAIDEDEANIDYTFDLNEFFATKDNGFFEHEAEVIKFLDCLATNEKYPFSTPELRDEIRHSFWLLNRVASAKAMERLLKKHDVFKDYTVVLAAGDGRSDDGTDPVAAGKSLDKVRTAIAEAEESNGKTITLSVGQLTTGVTVPEWTAVIMLSNLSSPAQYMQAAFRAQNPCTFERAGHVFQKQNAYIFDFAPERTLTIFDAFANNLLPNPSGDQGVRQENIRTLLNFFPVLGEDAEGRMIELDASQVLTFPQVFKAREVVRRGFLSNLLFANVAGIFRYSEHVKEILDKLPTAKQGKVTNGQPIEIPQPPPVTDPDGNVQVDVETVINPKVAELGKPVCSVEDIPTPEPDAPAHTAATADREGGDRAEPPEARGAQGGLRAHRQAGRARREAHRAGREGPGRARLHRAQHRQQAPARTSSRTRPPRPRPRPSRPRGPSRTRPSRRTSWPSSTRRWTRSCPTWSPARRPRRSRSALTRRWTTPAPTCAASPARSPCSSWPTATATSACRTSTTTRPTTCSRRSPGSPKPSSASCATARRSPRRTAPSRRSRACSTRRSSTRPSRSSWTRRRRSPTTSTTRRPRTSSPTSRSRRRRWSSPRSRS